MVKVFNQGGIIIFPTDTAFGIGCRIDDEKAVEKLFKIRKRPKNQATPVLVSSIEMAKKYLEPLPKEVLRLMDRYWPGALTIIYRCRTKKVPSLVRGGGNTLGVRMPKNPKVIELINKIGVPILGPSANFYGEKTPYSIGDLDKELVKKVDYVLEGKAGSKGTISTVIDCSQKPFKIIRQGIINL